MECRLARFYHADRLLFLWEIEGVHVTDYLIGVPQEISGCLIKIMFLAEAEIAIRLVIKSRFYIMDFSLTDAKLGL